MNNDDKLAEIERLLFKARSDLLEIGEIVEELEDAQYRYLSNKKSSSLGNRNIVH